MGLQYVLSIFGRTLSDRPLSSAWRMTGHPEVNVFPMGTEPIQIPTYEFVARICRELATAFSERGATQLHHVRVVRFHPRRRVDRFELL